MVMSSKIFRIHSPINLDEVVFKLSKLSYQEGGLSVKIGEISRFKKGVRGRLEIVKHNTSLIMVSFYVIIPYKGGEEPFIILICERRLADKIAETLSSAGIMIGEIDLPMDKVRKLYEDGNVILLLIGVKDKGVKKALLYGDSVTKTEIYLKYLRGGRELYVVYKDKSNQVIGITSKGTVIFFTYVDEESLVRFIVDKLLPLC